MKNTNSNRVNAVNTTVLFCESNVSATSGIPLFSTVLGDVKAKMVLVNSLNQIADGSTKGVTLDTKLLRGAMVNLAFKCANGTLAYANSIGSNTLKDLVNFTMSDFERAKKEDVDDMCQTVHDVAAANVAAIASYGVLGTDVTDLQVAIDLYRVGSQSPRQAIVSRSVAKRQVSDLIREVMDDLLVGQLDKMVNTLRVSNGGFWGGYFQAREVVDLGRTTAKIRGTVKDGNDVPLVGVVFRVVEAGTSNVIAEVVSQVKGVFNSGSLPSGFVDLAWSFGGYETVEELNVKISAGKELRRRVVMVAQPAVVVREGNLGMGMIGNVDVSGLDNPDATVQLEAMGVQMNFFASNSLNGGAAGGVVSVQPGMPVEMKASQLAAAIGLGGVNSFLNVQNVGMMPGSWRVRFAAP